MAAGKRPLSSARPWGWSVRLAVRSLGLAIGWAAIALPAWACDTPVYRYAMYRWMPAPYEVYYFHRGQPPKADQEVHALLAADAKSLSVANVTLTLIDLGRKDALDTLPEPVKKAWQPRAKNPGPMHLVWTPWGEEVFDGKLDAAEAQAMLDSPLRTQIAKLLDQGNGIVLLVVGGSDAKENARIESAVREVIGKAASGEISDDPSPPPEPGRKPGGDGDAAAKPPGLRLALAKLDRADAKERWLLRMLMAMEPGLAKRAAEPMLFAVYGRGRVMPPGIGKEVTAESLLALVSFLAGRCSCTVKDQNPGLDLLMKWDWEATAEKYAKEDEVAARSQPLYREVAADGPEMTQASDMGAKQSGVGGATAVTKASEPSKATPAKKPAPIAQVPGARPPSQATPAAKEDTQVKAQAEVVATAAPDSRVAARSFISRQARGIGLGLAAMAAVVVAAGFVLVRFVRKRNHDSP